LRLTFVSFQSRHKCLIKLLRTLELKDWSNGDQKIVNESATYTNQPINLRIEEGEVG